MSKSLTWLHLSDIHFYANTEWRDSAARESLLTYLRNIFEKDDSLLPDLIFCTGDIAFGETGSSPLDVQYSQAKAFFDSLLAACGRNGTPLPKERLFVVPGNHDVNRRSINTDAQARLTEWARQSRDHIGTINQRFRDSSIEFKDAIKRLDEYARFIRDYLPHQMDADARHCYASIVNINGLKVGIAGFNSAWSCAGPEDDRAVWLAAEWQFNTARTPLSSADVRIGLIHHPIDWLNEAERDIATHRLAQHFHFWLHGHSHNAWVTPNQTHVIVAAGAVGAQAREEFGVNLVRFDMAEAKGVVHLHTYEPRDSGWTIAPVPNLAPQGQWYFDLPSGLRNVPPPTQTIIAASLPAKRTPGLFGRERLLKEATAKLQRNAFLLVYGLRGNGKTVLIEELGKVAPLAGKEPVRFTVTASTTADDMFRQVAALLEETAEVPRSPSGDSTTIAAEIKRRYPSPRQAWIWIDRSHNLLDEKGFLRPEIRRLLLGLHAALGMRWHWVLELREKPHRGLLGDSASECEVPGLDKASLAECLAQGAPEGEEADWHYTGDQLKGIYQWLGGGQGNQAHPLATQLLIEVARGRNETPLAALRRHLGDLTKKLEEKLLTDLYNNVLSPPEQRMLQALALYRSAIPHDHADLLERDLNVGGAWDMLDRRCLLSSSPDHSLYYIHSFIAGWLRTRLGYVGFGEEEDADFADATGVNDRLRARNFHAVIASCWLNQLGDSRRMTNVNIGRALEAFHHLVAAGEADRVANIAVRLLSGNLEWARNRIERLYTYLHKSKAPVTKLRQALEYAVVLSPDDAKVHRYLGECWAREENRASPKALMCFEEACRLERDFPPHWANLGRTLLAQGKEGAKKFLRYLEELREDCPKAIDNYIRSIESECLELTGQAEQAEALRWEQIRAGSRDPVFYNAEAKARLEAGDAQGAMEVLDLAEKNQCASEITMAIRASALQQCGRVEEAAALRCERIFAGSRHPAFYNDEAKARLEAGDARGALEVINLAEKNGCADRFTPAIKTNVLRKLGAD